MARPKKEITEAKPADDNEMMAIDESVLNEDEEFINKNGKVEKIDADLKLFAQDAEKAVANEKKAFKELSPERIARNEYIAKLANSDNVDDVMMAKQCVCDDCDAFITSYTRYMLSRCPNGNIVDLEDCINEVYLLVFDKLHTYKPNYSLLTFIRPKIIRTIQESRKTNSGMTTHYLALIPTIEAAIAKFAEKGISNPTEKDIHIETGISMKTIAATLGQLRASNEIRIDDMDYDTLDSTLGSGSNGTAGYNTSPENIFMLSETSSLLGKAMAKLSEVERNIVQWRVIDEINWNTIAEMSDSEPEIVKQLYSKALKKLYMDRDLDQFRYVDKTNESRFETHQIPMIPYTQGMNLLDDIDLMDEQETANANPANNSMLV